MWALHNLAVCWKVIKHLLIDVVWGNTNINQIHNFKEGQIVDKLAAVFLNNTIGIVVCSQGAPGFVISTMVYYKNKQAFHPKTNFKLISLNAIQRKNVCIKILGAKLIKNIVLRARLLRSLCHSLRLLENMRFLGTFGFGKICLKSWYLWLGTKTNYVFFSVFLFTVFSLNMFHTLDIAVSF